MSDPRHNLRRAVARRVPGTLRQYVSVNHDADGDSLTVAVVVGGYVLRTAWTSEWVRAVGVGRVAVDTVAGWMDQAAALQELLAVPEVRP